MSGAMIEKNIVADHGGVEESLFYRFKKRQVKTLKE